jgi:hypothetical protein
VAGVNDVVSDSCQDVHQRLHVNSGGCSFPAGYGSGSAGGGGPTAPPAAPKHLRITAVG